MTKQELITKVEAERDNLYTGNEITDTDKLCKLTTLLFMLKAEEAIDGLSKSLGTIDFAKYAGGVK